MRAPVELRHAYRLLNHGPTTLLSAASGEQQNVMAAAWVMPLDFEPPKLAAVIASGTHTRALVEASGEFCVSLPTTEQLALTYAVGTSSGKELDKQARFGLSLSAASQVKAPLVEGCAAWLECRVLEEPGLAERYDLFVAEVLAAWADDALFSGGEWRFSGERRTIHHLARGIFFATGERLEVKKPT